MEGKPQSTSDPHSTTNLVIGNDCVANARIESPSSPEGRAGLSIFLTFNLPSHGRREILMSVAKSDHRGPLYAGRHKLHALSSSRSTRGLRVGERSKRSYRAMPAPVVDASPTLPCRNFDSHRQRKHNIQIFVQWKEYPQRFNSWDPFTRCIQRAY